MRLNGWGRLWIVWAVLTLPTVMIGVAEYNPIRSEWQYQWDERERAWDTAQARLRRRIEGETGQLASFAQLLQGDDQYRQEIHGIDVEFEPKL